MWAAKQNVWPTQPVRSSYILESLIKSHVVNKSGRLMLVASLCVRRVGQDTEVRETSREMGGGGGYLFLILNVWTIIFVL